MAIDTVNIEDICELSPLQQGMLFHTLYAPRSGLYFEQISFVLRSGLDIRAFECAWQKVIDRHSILRASFHWEDMEKPVQVIHRQARLPFERYDWRNLTSVEQEKKFRLLLRADSERGFELSEPPLMRLICIELSPNTFQFIWSFHHILLDGWSVQLVLKDVSTYYEALAQGRSVELKPPRPYGDYIEWLQRQDFSAAEEFWRRTLKGFTAPTLLGVSSRTSQEESYNELEVALSGETMAALNALARQHQLTVNNIVQGAWAVLLSRYSNTEDVLFGAVVSGRPAALQGVESMVGLFINTLPVLVRAVTSAPLLTLFKQIQAQQFDACQYEYSPLLHVQRWSEVPNGVPLFESVIVFENYPVDTSLRERGRGRTDTRHIERTNYPLTVLIVPGSELWLKFLYDCRRFDAATVKRMADHFQVLLEGIVNDPKQSASQLPLLTQAERTQLLVKWIDSARDYPSEPGLVALFERRVEQRPEATAFIYNGETLSYGELNRRANQLAHYLRGLGVGPEVLVGLCLERSLDMAVGLLGILKSGGSYLPLDPSYPQERLAWMLEDARAPVVVTRERFASLISGDHVRQVWLDTEQEIISALSETNLACPVSPDNLAYVIYTSGSTGRPKGAAVEHKQLLNRFAWMWEAYPFEADEVACQKTAANFVDSIWELLGPLLQGIPTVIIPDEFLRDIDALVRILAEHGVTRIWVVPSLLRAMLNTYPDLERRLPKLKFWVTSGEALSPDLFQKFRELMPRSVLYNLYGTSEVWDATWFDPEQPCDHTQRAPIGRGIANVETYVLDPHLNPVPVGVVGELYVGGVGLARGYLNRAELTAERFIPHPFSHRGGERLYCTGDLARYLDDGNLQYVGRRDHQVKLRGFRVELAEVESVLSEYEGVREAVVVKSKGDGERLVGYVAAEPGVTVVELEEHASRRLPEYMRPSALVLMERMPLTPNGKVDRLALPVLEHIQSEAMRSYVAPRTPLEQGLERMFAEVLRLERVGVEDNFFRHLGGHSLLATQLVSRVRSSLQVELPLRAIFEQPTVAALAGVITKLQESVDAERKAPDAPSLKPLSREEYMIRINS